MRVIFTNGRAIEAEVASTPQEQRTGMLKYDQPPRTAMWFPYEMPTNVQYHMVGMKFPLDILMLRRVPDREAQYIRPEEAEVGFQIGDEVEAVKTIPDRAYTVSRGERLRVVDVGSGGGAGDYLVVSPVGAPLRVELTVEPWKVRRAANTPEEAVMRYTTGDVIKMVDEMEGSSASGPVALHPGERFVVKEVWPNTGRIIIYRYDGLGSGDITLRVSRRIAMELSEVCPACKRLKARCKGRTACYRAAGVRVAQSESAIELLWMDGESAQDIAHYLELPVEEVQAVLDRIVGDVKQGRVAQRYEKPDFRWRDTDSYPSYSGKSWDEYYGSELANMYADEWHPDNNPQGPSEA